MAVKVFNENINFTLTNETFQSIKITLTELAVTRSFRKQTT